jgi:hypothetical protein
MKLKHSLRLSVCALAVGLVGVTTSASALEYNVDDWQVTFENTIHYNLGFRAWGADPRILNDPHYSISDNKFPDALDIVTNRISDSIELDIFHGDDYGVSATMQVWKDFAYNKRVNEPALAVGNSGYSSGHLQGQTVKYYLNGMMTGDAFAFLNTEVGDTPVSIKAGRFTEYWGIALFSGFQAIAYSQAPINGIAGAQAPGTLVKDLFMPRWQASIKATLTPEIEVGGEYFFEFRKNLSPEAGTFFGTTNFMFYGPDRFAVAPGHYIPRVADSKPQNVHSNFGVYAKWSPEGFRGTIGLYYRLTDEVQNWSPMIDLYYTGYPAPWPPVSVSQYRYGYNQDVSIFGLSIDKEYEKVDYGLEVSYRRHTALMSESVDSGPPPYFYTHIGLPYIEGAKGNTLNVVTNFIAGLTPTMLYDGGAWVGELAWTHLDAVTSNAYLYNGVGYGCAAGRVGAGCSSRDAVSINTNFDPNWMQVFPGVDLDLPLTVSYGLYGTGASLGVPFEHSLSFSAGINAKIMTNYFVTLTYNGNRAHHGPVIAGAVPGTSVYDGGAGGVFYNDRDWISLSIKTTF